MTHSALELKRDCTNGHALAANSDVKDYLRMRANTSDSCFDLGDGKNFRRGLKLFLFSYKPMKTLNFLV